MELDAISSGKEIPELGLTEERAQPWPDCCTFLVDTPHASFPMPRWTLSLLAGSAAGFALITPNPLGGAPSLAPSTPPTLGPSAHQPSPNSLREDEIFITSGPRWDDDGAMARCMQLSIIGDDGEDLLAAVRYPDVATFSDEDDMMPTHFPSFEDPELIR